MSPVRHTPLTDKAVQVVNCLMHLNNRRNIASTAFQADTVLQTMNNVCDQPPIISDTAITHACPGVSCDPGQMCCRLQHNYHLQQPRGPLSGAHTLCQRPPFR